LTIDENHGNLAIADNYIGVLPPIGEWQMPEPELWVTEEVADYLRTPVQTLYQWRHSGKGPPAHRVGKRLLYRREDVLAWLAERRDDRVA
jgi:excisionase family DNA binding protein